MSGITEKQIGNFRILEQLGQGGGGTVYKAQDTTLHRTVVIKVLPPELVNDEGARKRFLREARLASQLDHPNICTIHSIEEAGNLYFIVMQWIEGRTLKQIVAQRPLDLGSAMSIALQVGDALVAAHSKGIIHRDIKSSNIVITDRGQAKILDFGLAKLAEPGQGASATMTDLTRSGAHLGTPSYMSPEQASGELTDHRGDIFSFGVVLYEMLTGKLPFTEKGRSTVDVMHAVIHDAAPALSASRADMPASLQGLLDRALSKSPRDRFQSAREMLSALQAVAREIPGAPVTVPDGAAAPYSAPKHTRPSWRDTFIGRWVDRVRSRGATGRTPPSESVREESINPEATSQGQEKRKKKLAILPFRNLSRDPETDFYGFSLADSVITEMASVKQLIVRPSSYVAKYQNQETEPRVVGQELGVDAILVGSFLKGGNILRVTPQLINIETGEILWSEKIDVEYENIISLQDQISRRIVAGLKLQITDQEQEQMAAAPTDSPEAYELYLRGRDLMFRFSMQTTAPKDLEAAIDAFRKSTELDPDFALAYAARGRCHVSTVLRSLGGVENYAKAETVLKKALDLYPELVEARLYLLYPLLVRGEIENVRSQRDELLHIAPNDPLVRRVAADLYRWDGLYAKALRQYNRWLRLSPKDAALVHLARGRLLQYQLRFDEATEEMETGLAIEPDQAFIVPFVGLNKYYLGDVEGAIETLERIRKQSPEMLFSAPLLGICYAASGRTEEALALLDSRVVAAGRADGDVAYWIASVYSQLGQPGCVLEWFERAIHLGNRNYPWFSVDPNLDPLRQNVEFQSILESLRVSWEALAK